VSGTIRLDPAAVRRTLRDAGLAARRSMSQNFLADVEVLEAILAEAGPVPGRRILEIGPGLGVLTGALLEAGAAVTAIELDSGLAARLRRVLADPIDLAAGDPSAAGGLRLIEGDALDVDLAAVVSPPYDVVANLPYHVTSPILHRLLGAPPRPERSVLMLQREVAERIAAQPGEMSYLAVFVRYHAAVRIVRLVAPDSFEPAPEVWSAVVAVEPPGEGADAGLSAHDEDDLWRVVQAGFRERRKKLRNVLARQMPMDQRALIGILESVGIDPDRRPQTLSVGEWIALRGALREEPRSQRQVDR
jgi:16S rRNA (adenine1518-N6/adenine1519-N6)-dimethyltransferase